MRAPLCNFINLRNIFRRQKSRSIRTEVSSICWPILSTPSSTPRSSESVCCWINAEKRLLMIVRDIDLWVNGLGPPQPEGTTGSKKAGRHIQTKGVSYRNTSSIRIKPKRTKLTWTETRSATVYQKQNCHLTSGNTMDTHRNSLEERYWC